MYQFLTCPQCQARLRVTADVALGRFRCGSCGFEFAPPGSEPEMLDAIPVEDTRIQPAEEPTLVHPLEEPRPKPAIRAGCFLHALALSPLVIPLLAVPFCRFGNSWIGNVLWGVVGVALTLMAVVLVRRTRWSWALRLLLTLGVTGAGHLFLLGALAVSFWLWLHRIDPSDWRDFAPPGGRFHVSVPGTPTLQPARVPGLPAGVQTYSLELHRQDIAFAISYADVPLDEWNQMTLESRFAGSLTGIQSRIPGSQLVNQKRIALDGNPGREFHLEIPGRAVIVARVYFVRNRLFVLLIAGSRIKADSEEVSKFLDSFRPDPLDEKQFPPLRPDEQPPDFEDEDVHPGRKIISHEKEFVRRLVLSRDGGTLAAGLGEIARDGTIELWSLGNGEQRLGSVPIHLDRSSFDLSPDGKTLAIEDPAAGIRLFDVQTQKEIALLGRGGREPAWVSAVVFSRGGRYLAVSHQLQRLGQAEIRVWDVPARKLVRSISAGKGVRNVMVFSPDGRHLVTGTDDGIIRWFDPLTGGEVKRFALPANNAAQPEAVTALAFSGDGETLAAGYLQTLRLWDVRTGKERVLLNQRGTGIRMLEVSLNGRFIAIGTDDGTLCIVETANGKQRWIDLGPRERNGLARPLVFTPDGRHLILVRQNRIERWELEKLLKATPDELAEPKQKPAAQDPTPSPGDPPPRIEAHVVNDPNARHGVFGLALSPDGKTLITAGWDRNLRIWDLAADIQKAEGTVGIDPVGLSASSDGKIVAVAVPSTVYLYDARTAEMLDTLTPDAAEIVEAMMDPQLREILKKRGNGQLPPPPAGAVKIAALAFAPDGKTLATAYAADRSGVVELWDVAAKKSLRRFVTEPAADKLAFSPDGKTLALGRENDARVRLYDVTTGKDLAQLPGIDWGTSALACSGDGRFLAAAGSGNRILLWDLRTGRELFRLTDARHRIVALAFSPDGRTLASGDFEGTVRVHDTASGKCIGTFAARAACLLFSKDSKHLFAGCYDGWVEVWGLASLPRPAPPPEPIAGNKAPERPLAFGKDLQRIGTIEPFLAAAVDPQGGKALLLRRDRFLRVCSYPDFRPQKAYWLGVTAYRATLDAQHGKLYAAVCDVPNLKIERDGRVHGPTDLYVYDVKQVLAGEDVPGGILKPIAVIGRKAEITHLFCTPDGRWMCYLDVSDPRNAQIGRIDTATNKPDSGATVATPAGGFCVSRDGRTLYVGRTLQDAQRAPQHWKGEIEVIDVATMQVRQRIEVPSQPAELAADDDLLYFGGKGPLGIVDLRAAPPKVVAHWEGPWLAGSLRIGAAPRQVYLCENAIPASIAVFRLSDDVLAAKNDRPMPADKLSDKGDGSLLGDMQVTPDGKYLLSRAGVVVRLAVPGMNRPVSPLSLAPPVPAEPQDVALHEREPIPAGELGSAQAVALDTEGKMIAVGNGNRGVSVYERDSGKQLGWGSSEAGIAYLAFAVKGKKRIISTTVDRGGQIRVASPGTAIGDAYAYFHETAGYGLDALALTADGREIAAAGGATGKDVVFWNSQNGRRVKTVKGFPDPLTAVALSPDGKWVAAGSTTGPLRLVNLTNPKQTRTWKGHSAEVRCLAYAPDGKLLASGGVDATVRLWDADTGQTVHTLNGHNGVVLCLAFSPDGKTLITGGADGTLRLWDPATGKQRGWVPPRRPGAMVYAIAISADGKALAAACGVEVRQWEMTEANRP